MFQIVERIVENGMIKVKRKIVKKKKTEPETVKVETSTTSSTSSVFGKSILKRPGHVICFRRTVVRWYGCPREIQTLTQYMRKSTIVYLHKMEYG